MMKALCRLLCSTLLYLLMVLYPVSARPVWIPAFSEIPSVPELKSLETGLHINRFSFELPGFHLTAVGSADSSFRISAPGMSPLLVKGAPDLPKFSFSLAIPDRGGLTVQLVNPVYREYSGWSIAPGKGNLYRDVDPSTVPLQADDKIYQQDRFWPEAAVQLNDPYILRDFRGQAVHLQPFSYNPKTRVLRVLVAGELIFTHAGNIPSINELHRTAMPHQVDPEFARIYDTHFRNASALNYVPLEEQGELLIICPNNWIAQLQPLVDWKRRKGIRTTIVNRFTAGYSAIGIQTFINQFYLQHPLTYVLLVGDINEMPSLKMLGGVSDPSYGFLSGTDAYAEIFVGRMSAQNVFQLKTQVDRTLDYEMRPDTIHPGYEKAAMLASNLGPGDDNEYDWEHARNISNDLLGYTYTGVSELYDGNHPGGTDLTGNPSAFEFNIALSNNVGVVNYTGHATFNQLTTTGFTGNDLNNLLNQDILPVFWSVACFNGEFDNNFGPCLAESFLQAELNGKPAGAAAAFMSSISQSWNPPMDAQDEIADILTQQYPSNRKRSFAGLSMNGCFHMNDVYQSQGEQMTATWNVFGDPSLDVRTAKPHALTASHIVSDFVGIDSLVVVPSDSNAVVALSINNELLAVLNYDGSDSVLHFPKVNLIDTIVVTVTALNAYPYTGYVLVQPTPEAYVVQRTVVNHEINGNLDGRVEILETFRVDVRLKNIGLSSAINCVGEISSIDTAVIIQPNQIKIGNLLPLDSAMYLSAFTYSVADGVKDQHEVVFQLLVQDTVTSTTAVSFFTQVINAPELKHGLLLVNDSSSGNKDQMLQPGETADVHIRILNTGHSDAKNCQGVLSSSSPFVTILNPSATVPTIPAGSYADAVYPVSLSTSLPFSSTYDLVHGYTAGLYNDSNTYYLRAGLIVEDFETGTFTRFPWRLGGNMPWLISNYQPYEGNWCSVSGDINDLETSTMSLMINAGLDDTVSFWYRTSCEAGWDYLQIYIDNVWKAGFTGISTWQPASIPVTVGSHDLRFAYEKDGAYSLGLDCAWLDNIVFPYGTNLTGLEAEVVLDHLAYALIGNPARNNTMLQVSGPAQSVAVSVFDLNGKRVKPEVRFTHTGGSSLFSLSMRNLSQGLYQVVVQDNEGSKRLPLLVLPE